MVRSLITFLGIGRIQALIALFALTGLTSAVLNSVADESTWARDGQTVLVAVWLFGTIGIIISAMDAFERGRWIGILVPAGGAVILGLLFPSLLGLMLGLAVGWVIAGGLIFRPRSPQEYRSAVRHLRKGRYKEGVEEMTALIKRQPEEPAHYRFRAELFRVWGRLDRARRDYQKMIELAPDMAVAWNGLAEVELQSGNYPEAEQAAVKALELAPSAWVAAYNLGMIQDRTGDAENAVRNLKAALDAKVPDARHRLLIHLYMARGYARLGDEEAAQAALKQLRRHGGGLNQWQVILQSEQAETLRNVIADDIALIERILYEDADVEQLS